MKYDKGYFYLTSRSFEILLNRHANNITRYTNMLKKKLNVENVVNYLFSINDVIDSWSLAVSFWWN